jgi:hypothetical protein
MVREMGGHVELGYSSLTRRERLERIAMAERDRRAGRVDVAIAALGEASEWPAMVVLALARLPEFEAAETRQILEEGLDDWASEVGLQPFDELPSLPEPEPEPEHGLGLPIEHAELERAFDEAEAQTDEMHSANHVAERILMDEPVGLTELEGDPDAPFEELDVIAMDAAMVEHVAPLTASSPLGETGDSRPSRLQVVAILERWLQNLEQGYAGRAR